MLAAYCKAKGFVLSDLMKLKYMQIVQEKYGFKDWDSILAALGHGGLKEGRSSTVLQKNTVRITEKN